MPRTVVAREPHQIGPALDAVGGPPVVLKLIRGTQGIGVILAETEQAVQSVLDTLWSLGQTILIQEFVAESEGRDIRALVVGNRVVTAMRRQARFGEFRSNIHRGGGGVVVDLDEDFRRTAIQATQVMGLHLAGVDLLESHEGPKVMEINSSPGFEGLERATGIDIAGAIIRYAVRFARRRGKL
jgi:ribosomal protein S6--L-glutamate ligase